MKYKFRVLVITFLILGCSPIAHAEPLYPDIGALAYVLIDAKSGQILVQKDADKKLYPASTTKIMTAIVAIENSDISKKMVASRVAVNSIGPGGMNIGILPGEEFTLDELLNALLIRSANESAYIIAENTSGSVSKFVDLMNKKAEQIGATNTHFSNPCGMDVYKDQQDHLSTANDLAKMAYYAMNLPNFREITGRKSSKIGPTNMRKTSIELYSTNKLLITKYKSGLYSRVTGIKTGYTQRAGHNLVASAIDDNSGMELISVILGVKDPAGDKVFVYSKRLLEYGFKRFHFVTIVEKDDIITQVPVDGANRDTMLNLVSKSQIKNILPVSDTEVNIQRTLQLNNTIKAPIIKGTVLGHAQYSSDGVEIGCVDLVSESDVNVNLWRIYLNNFFKFISNISILILGVYLLKKSMQNKI